MARVPIVSVRIDEDGRIRVRPEVSKDLGGYQYIWREAAWVRWDVTTSELYVTQEKMEPVVDQFDRIRRVLMGIGNELVFKDETVFDNLPDDAVQHIRGSLDTK